LDLKIIFCGRTLHNLLNKYKKKKKTFQNL